MRAALLALTLTGCTIQPWIDETSQEAVDRYRAANANLSNASEAWLCRGMSIREWMLRFGDSPERAEAWRVLCDGRVVVTPTGGVRD